MPRQIIDTESSRPAYVRRRLVSLAAAILAIAAAAGVAWVAWAHHLLPGVR
ncbi:MAG TPA: hypothetical protein VGF86_04435 [Candidatus Tumulicola sp.]